MRTSLPQRCALLDSSATWRPSETIYSLRVDFFVRRGEGVTARPRNYSRICRCAKIEAGSPLVAAQLPGNATPHQGCYARYAVREVQPARESNGHIAQQRRTSKAPARASPSETNGHSSKDSHGKFTTNFTPQFLLKQLYLRKILTPMILERLCYCCPSAAKLFTIRTSFSTRVPLPASRSPYLRPQVLHLKRAPLPNQFHG